MLGDTIKKIEDKSAIIGVVGMGYVGLPLALTFIQAGFKVIGFDTDQKKITSLKMGQSYIKEIPANSIFDAVDQKKLVPTLDFSLSRTCDALIICVPTPLTTNREPDISYITSAVGSLAKYARKDQLYVLESTTYPGTTDEIVKPILEKSTGLVVGKDIFLAFSPEREDPGNKNYNTKTIPKIVSGYNQHSLLLAKKLYSAALDKIVPVSSTKTAEMVKLFENIYRTVNIAVVNELKILCAKLGIDVWEVIKAASTKPFGFQAFYPGPGIGGHCLPLDPFYLTWKAREFDMTPKFIEVAGEINSYMPYYVVEQVGIQLNEKQKSLKKSEILVIGVAYKKDIDDIRESPALKIIGLLRNRGAIVRYYDPYVASFCLYDDHHNKILMESDAELKNTILKDADCVLILTDHSNIDYDFIAQNSEIVIDTRNCVPRKYKNTFRA